MKPRTTMLLALFCIISLLAIPVYADTDGSELQILNPANLEIQLGSEWAGAEFQLRTDMGIYPDSIHVDERGILRLEIGGSKSYMLSSLTGDKPAVSYPDDNRADFSLLPDTSSGSSSDKAQPSTSIGTVIVSFGIGLAAGLCGAFAIRSGK